MRRIPDCRVFATVSLWAITACGSGHLTATTPDPTSVAGTTGTTPGTHANVSDPNVIGGVSAGLNPNSAPAPLSPRRSIVSGAAWFDTQGNLMNAHGAGLFEVDRTFYLVGEVRSGNNLLIGNDLQTLFAGVACYSSTDLLNWTNLGLALNVTPQTPLDGQSNAERPRVLYNRSTQRFVMALSTTAGSVALAESSQPCSGYAYVGNLTLNGAPLTVGDVGVFQEEDGTAYVLGNNGGIYPLSADYHTALSANAVAVFPQSTEAPAVLKVDGVYFYVSSPQYGWYADDDFYATATAMAGPWTLGGTLAPSGSHTYDSQVSALFNVHGGKGNTVVYLGDRWCDGCFPSSTAVWQPMTVNGSSLAMPAFNAVWVPNVQPGDWAAQADAGTWVNDSLQGTGLNQFHFANWQHKFCSLGDSCFNGDNTVASTPNALSTFKFNGTQTYLYAGVDPGYGILGVSVCDANGAHCAAEVLVSLYSPARASNQLVWTSKQLDAGTYTLMIRLTGSKDYYSGGIVGNIDRISVF